MSRPRKPSNGDLPKYLHPNRDSYIYTPPNMPPMGMGNDRDTAIQAATQLNEMYGLTTAMVNLVDSFVNKVNKINTDDNQPTPRPISSPKGTKPLTNAMTLEQLLKKWLVFYKEEKRPKDSTFANTRARVNRISRHEYAQWGIDRLTTYEFAQILKPISRSDYPKIRGILTQSMIYAKEQGWLPSTLANQAAETGTRRKKDKERRRMTLAQFHAIYQRAPDFIQDAMDIIMQTTLRRGDVCNLRLDDTNPNYYLRDNKLYVVPEKSNSANREKGPSYLFWDLNKNTRLANVIKRARERSLTLGRCPFVINTKPARITRQAKDAKEHHAQVMKSWLSKQFAKVRKKVIEETDLFEGYKKEELPGIHEVRALASHLLDKQGVDTRAVAELMAHTDESMTERYQSGHETEWREMTLQVNY